MRSWSLIIGCLITIVACRRPQPLFEQLKPDETGIDFTNNITETQENNIFTYQYYYNGNGVAVGDVNNDGLTDVFITGNQTPSKLYLNKGNFRFADITAAAGVAGKHAWRTGANMVDINGDGLLDIFVCYSGFGSAADRAKQFFINTGVNKDGIPVFTDKAAEMGLDAPGTYTSQSSFFDYDLDGDLDMFLLNHANEFYSPFFNTTRLRTLRHPQYGNRLYRNDNGHFTDVSDSAGIFGGGNNFGLGIAVSDLNDDGWPDILVSNDFHEQDYLYLNKKDGTFREVCQQVFAHMSRNTMGLDIADFNNDGLPDVMTLDMLPEDNYRQKVLQGPDEYDKYTLMVDSGYGHQNNRNMLQLHQGFAPDGLPVFAEIGQLAGVSNTDWSWASLFADFDNDGLKDLFVTNGYLRESTNLDFMRYEVAEALLEARRKGLDVSTPAGYAANMPLYNLVKKLPSTKISNYAFGNKGDLSFANKTKEWGLDEPGVSSGATYADLDNDGDLDLIVCNNNQPVWVYKNHSREKYQHHFIKIKLAGTGRNVFGIGAKVVVLTENGQQMQEMFPVRGYQSSVDYVLHFGLGKQERVKQVRVSWQAGETTVLDNPSIDAIVTVSKGGFIPRDSTTAPATGLFADLTAQSGIGFIPVENKFVDFKREYLIPAEMSKQGPKMATADVNGDGLDDVYIGSPATQSSILYLQQPNGTFIPSPSQPWQADAICEDIHALFFDADNDNDPDLYVVSGGSEWLIPGHELQDRIYRNDGKGIFTKCSNALPLEAYSGTVVTAADFDHDGDLDLFTGASCIPGSYPLSAGNRILRNDVNKTTGELHFTDITKTIAGDPLFTAGIVTGAVWTDLDKDSWPDLIIAGQWMPVMIFHNEQGKKLVNTTAASGLEHSNGWWCSLAAADIDRDGDTDLIAGNMGLNTQFRASEQEPLITYVNDFDNNGKLDPIMTWYIQHVSYPFNSRDEIVGQLPMVNKKFLRYSDYAAATIEKIFTKKQIDQSRKFTIYNTSSALFINEGGKFRMQVLPMETQFSVVNAIQYHDFDSDGISDLLLTGNFYPFRVQQGRCDASIGSLLKGNGAGGFSPMSRKVTGLYVPGDVRDMVMLKGQAGNRLIISKNNAAVQVLTTKAPLTANKK